MIHSQEELERVEQIVELGERFEAAICDFVRPVASEMSAVLLRQDVPDDVLYLIQKWQDKLDEATSNPHYWDAISAAIECKKELQ